METKIQISAAFDGGNIEVVNSQNIDDIQLKIRKDNASEFRQWFYFRISGIAGQECRIRIVNAHECAYAKGWEDYDALFSSDRIFWSRAATDYLEGELQIILQGTQNSVYVAMFEPYSMERHADFVAFAQHQDQAQLISLGKSLQGLDMDLIKVGEEDKTKKVCWVVARQHPGETMAEWWVEGFVERLLDQNDAVSRLLLERMVFYIVPNMNPDGSRLGNHRTNAAGVNLNRAWLQADMKTCPEVFLVRGMMHKTGVDICFDVHGDEALPYNFVNSAQGVASWDDHRSRLLSNFVNSLAAINPDFQTEYGYPVTPKGKANLAMCTNYVAENFGCLAMTHEMPYKDTANLNDFDYGWTAERSKLLGASNLSALYQVIDQI